MSVADRIIAMACEEAGVSPADVSPRTLVSDLKMDSLSFMDLVMRLEEAEGVVMGDEEVEKILGATYLAEIIAIFETARARTPEVI
ncbi:phosphopantetheine-binding protein [Caulobacter rhizosphaerae]|jgi:acyl carrier protein|uniref:phosphopantetheine-binding protein n=1 Tax=Caulobacter rhizosphaerae TaxID=2010972 RepID=UPI0013D69979|nr:phosphopantetheine-binding protein [Caulobacter rhizosphaerae]GGL41514.1 hypothetical protein GCM10010983_43460 [Caulobacter rhizosphaerae]HWU13782.1 phosphopantetheine-binding protein [Caulobacter sp.]